MLYVQPAAGNAPIIQVIEQARHSIDLNVYYLSDRGILRSLADAVRRGVRVRIILDGRPYKMAPAKVQREFAEVRATGASVQQAPARFEMRYVFDHAKYICSSHVCEIGTANFDWSAFHRNREYLWVTRQPAIVQSARAVFDADWANTRAPSAVRKWLVLSPGATQAIETMIAQPGPVEIESEEMGSDRQILRTIEAKGAQAQVILPESISSEDRRNAQALAAHGVQVRLMPKSAGYMHAKMILGQQWTFIGSQNFSVSSLDRNREMGVVLTGASIAPARAQFATDWNTAIPLSAVPATAAEADTGKVGITGGIDGTQSRR